MKKILIVEDQPEIRRLIRMTLDLDACEIHEAEDAQSGWIAANKVHPDVVLLDVMMPGSIDGFDLCLALKIEPALAGTRVIMLTALGGAGDRQNGHDMGADAYLVKPFSPMELLRQVEALA